MTNENESPKLTKAEQNRINGAKSKGPTSSEGKAVCSRNAIKHGFAATQNVVISIEDQPAFLLHRDGVRSAFNPQNYVEFELVDKLASISWRQSRLVAIETALIDAQISFQVNAVKRYYPSEADESYVHLLLAWQALAGVPHKRPVANEPNILENPEGPLDINSMELVRRYQVSLDRQYRNALLNLRQYRKDFAGSAIPTPAQQPEIVPFEEPVLTPPQTASQPAEPIEPKTAANPRPEPNPLAPSKVDGDTTSIENEVQKLPRAA